ncbi:MAG: aminotransferase class I/II-fold pyridoxal phosphate-dependent enzyme [Pirellulaceae bacterium]
MRNEQWIDAQLASLRAASLERTLRVVPAPGGRFVHDGRAILNFSSNDYLDLARHPHVIAAAVRAVETQGGGAGASRLMAGTLACHEELEARLARLKGYPRALVFGSGYLTNAGVIPAVVGRDDAVYADRLVHASILDAVGLSRGKLIRFEHNDAGHLSELLTKADSKGRRLVVTESVFSMDGDLAPLADLAQAAEASEALLMVDEAHATGVFGLGHRGLGGSGLVREGGLEGKVNLSMGTLSKALGSYGGFVACSETMYQWLVNRARAFIYTTALPPAAVGAAIGALDVLEQEPGRGRELLARAERFRAHLACEGVSSGDSACQIVPVMVGDNAKALAVASRLKASGILALAVRPPTVPVGTARVRFSLTLAHGDDDLAFAAAQVVQALRAEGVV